MTSRTLKGRWLSNGKLAYPSEANAVEAIREHVPQYCRERVQCREVAVHVGALPVGNLHTQNKSE